MNAMARRVRGEQPAPSRRSNDPAMTQLVNAFQKSKTSGPNSDALRRALERAKSTSSATNTRALAKQIEDAMKRGNTTTLNALRKKLAVPVMSEKDGKVAKLEKYIVNKARKLNDKRRITFMNEAQKSIKAYKNGTNMYETAEARIAKVYENAYDIDTLQKNVNTIGNQKIKSSAREKLNAFKQSGGTDTSSKNAVIKLIKLDEELGKKGVNRLYLNEMRDEALQNIQSYNIRNGLAKINTRVKEDMKKRGAEFNELTKNDAYKNVQSNVRTKLRNAYVSGILNISGVKRGLNNALEESAGVYKGLENKIKNLEAKLGNSKLTANERNTLKKERNNLKQRLNRNAKNMNVMREQLGNMKTTVNTKNRNIERLKIKQGNANNEIEKLRNKLQKNKNLSNGEKRALQEQLNNAMKNRANINNRLRKSEAEKMQYMREMNTLAGNVRNITKQKENANEEISSLRNKLQQNKNLSNGEKRALQEQLNNAMKNRANINNRLRKSEAEKMQYMREMNTLAGNARNKNKEINQIKKNMAAAGSLSMAQKEKLRQNLEKAQSEKAEMKKESDMWHNRLLSEQEELRETRIERENLRANATKAALERNNLKAESNKRQQALKEAAEKEAEITKKLGESNASIKNLTEQRAKLLEKGELNAAEKAKLERIRKELTDERNAKNNEIRRLQTLSKNRKNALKKISTKLNEATRSLARSEGLISTQKENLEAKNANLLKKIVEIEKTQSNVARLQKELTNTKTASAAEKNAIKKQLEAETAKLVREKETLEGSRVALIQQRNQLKKQFNMAEGGRIALINKLKQLQKSKNISNKQRNVFREQLRKVQAQRRNLRGGMSANQAQYATTRSQLEATQKNLATARLNEQRAKQRIVEASRLTRNRASNTQNFNATAAFQQMSNRLTTNKNAWKRGVRGRWQNVARPGATYLKNEENLRVAKSTLRALINSKRPNGNYTIGGLFGQKRRQLKSELERVFNMTQLREIRKKIAAAKNIKNTEVAQKRMNKTLSMAGSSNNNFKFGNRTQPIVNRGELLKQNNRNNAKKYINSLIRIGAKTKGQLKQRINMGENPKDVFRNAMSKNRKAGGPAAASRIRAQAYAS
jgi:chromosome segregation ATPase